MMTKAPTLILLKLKPTGFQICQVCYALDGVYVYEPIGPPDPTRGAARGRLYDLLPLDERTL